MRILQILPELNVGGVETGTVDFAKYLQQHGHHPVVVSNGGAMVADLQRQGIRHYQLPVHQKSLWSAVKCVQALRRIIRDEDIEVVHARSRIPAWIAFFACRETTAQFITTCHGYYANHFLSRVMGWAKFVIVPSEVIGRHMIETFKVPPENIRHIPRSVDLERFNVTREEDEGKSRYNIAIVGRITPLKGHVYFLKAMARVVRRMPYVKVWVIGDVPAKKESYRQELQLLVRRLGLSEHVEFLGNRKDVPQLLAQTDVLVLSSIVPEAFGRVVLEAQAVGVPVVATKVGGVIEIIDDEKTGLLVLPKDTDAMANAVMRLLNDRKFARQLAAAARQKIEEQFTLEHMASRTIKVYEELLRAVNILVIKISSLGDVVLITAALRAIRQKYPKANIYCLVGKEARKILQRCPYIDGIIVIDQHGTDKGFFQTLRLAAKLRRYQFDKIIDFQNNRLSHWLAFLSFARESYGYRNRKWGFLLSRAVPDDGKTLAPVEHQFKVLEPLGIEFHSQQYLELWPSENDQKKADTLFESAWLGEGANVVGINIAASEKWVTKNWAVANIATLCDILAGQNIRVVVTGMEKDRAAAQQLLSLTKTKPSILVGKTDVLELAAVIRRCKVYISVDSAPLHIAAAMRVPLIALFGPTDSRRHLPPAQLTAVMERKPPCAPCYSPQCRIATHVCMQEITPQEVAQQVKKLMKENKA